MNTLESALQLALRSLDLAYELNQQRLRGLDLPSATNRHDTAVQSNEILRTAQQINEARSRIADELYVPSGAIAGGR